MDPSDLHVPTFAESDDRPRPFLAEHFGPKKQGIWVIYGIICGTNKHMAENNPRRTKISPIMVYGILLKQLIPFKLGIC